MFVFFYTRYKTSIDHLKVLKTEVDHLKHLLHKSQISLMGDFQQWWQSQSHHSPGYREEQDERHAVARRDSLTPRSRVPQPHSQSTSVQQPPHPTRSRQALPYQPPHSGLAAKFTGSTGTHPQTGRSHSRPSSAALHEPADKALKADHRSMSSDQLTSARRTPSLPIDSQYEVTHSDRRPSSRQSDVMHGNRSSSLDRMRARQPPSSNDVMMTSQSTTNIGTSQPPSSRR